SIPLGLAELPEGATLLLCPVIKQTLQNYLKSCLTCCGKTRLPPFKRKFIGIILQRLPTRSTNYTITVTSSRYSGACQPNGRPMSSASSTLNIKRRYYLTFTKMKLRHSS